MCSSCCFLCANTRANVRAVPAACIHLPSDGAASLLPRRKPPRQPRGRNAPMSAPGSAWEEENIIQGVFFRKKSKQSVTVKTRFLQLSLGPKESCENLVFTLTNCFDFFREKTPGMIFSSSQALPGADVGAFLPLGWRGGFLILRGSSEAAPSEGR